MVRHNSAHAEAAKSSLRTLPIIPFRKLDQLLNSDEEDLTWEERAVVRLVLLLGEWNTFANAPVLNSIYPLCTHHFINSKYDIDRHPESASLMCIRANVLMAVLYKSTGCFPVELTQRICKQFQCFREWDTELSLVGVAFSYLLCEHPSSRSKEIVASFRHRIKMPDMHFLLDQFDTSFPLFAWQYSNYISKLPASLPQLEEQTNNWKANLSPRSGSNLPAGISECLESQIKMAKYYPLREFHGNQHTGMEAAMEWLLAAQFLSAPHRVRGVWTEVNLLMALYWQHYSEGKWLEYAQNTYNFAWLRVWPGILQVELEVLYKAITERCQPQNASGPPLTTPPQVAIRRAAESQTGNGKATRNGQGSSLEADSNVGIDSDTITNSQIQQYLALTIADSGSNPSEGFGFFLETDVDFLEDHEFKY
ncbi:hypothetical protein BGZ63DRAFT_452232 [Mariannaea sp. PMI_226]|nr:hypothetical protein BGZ63DRAFT_452232 [Mariannaea sp. PMI_226]